VVVVSAAYREQVAFPAAPSPRWWRGPVRVALAAWCGVLAGAIIGIVWHLPGVAGVLIGHAAAGAVLAVPLPAYRQAPLELAVADGELRLAQGRRTTRVPVSDIRRSRVLVEAGAGRRPVGYGPVFGRGLRWVWEIPDPALGVVRIDRGRGGLDLDVATAAPDALVDALRAAGAR
jgi:hypothetical protein